MVSQYHTHATWTQEDTDEERYTAVYLSSSVSSCVHVAPLVARVFRIVGGYARTNNDGERSPEEHILKMIPVPRFFKIIVDLVGGEVEKLKVQQWRALRVHLLSWLADPGSGYSVGPIFVPPLLYGLESVDPRRKNIHSATVQASFPRRSTVPLCRPLFRGGAQCHCACRGRRSGVGFVHRLPQESFFNRNLLLL